MSAHHGGATRGAAGQGAGVQGRAWIPSAVTLELGAWTQTWGGSYQKPPLLMGHRAQGVEFESHRIEAHWSKVGRLPKLKSWVLGAIGLGIMVTGFRTRSQEVKVITCRLLFTGARVKGKGSQVPAVQVIGLQSH